MCDYINVCIQSRVFLSIINFNLKYLALTKSDLLRRFYIDDIINPTLSAFCDYNPLC